LITDEESELDDKTGQAECKNGAAARNALPDFTNFLLVMFIVIPGMNNRPDDVLFNFNATSGRELRQKIESDCGYYINI